MKLKTSYFNLTVLKKDLTRFSPVWGLYAIFQLLFVLLVWGDENDPARFAVNASDIMMSMGILNLLYAGLCGFLLFGDLFKPRMCNMLHALPMRREGWFLTHFASGILFCLLPNLAGALLAALLLQQYAYAAFLWLAVMMLQYLFFFGSVVFAVMCAGNVLGGIAVYGLFNFLAVLVAWLAVTFYEPVMYGMKLHIEYLAEFSPAVAFSTAKYFDFVYDNMDTVANFSFSPEDWQYLAVAGGVGLVLLGLALLIYRRRDLESAGDLIALKPVAPVFLVIYTLCMGAVMYFVADAFSNGLEYVFLLIGFAIGFFTGKMLLEKRINVFRLKNAARFGILVAAFVLSIVIAIADPFGITRYVPNADSIAVVRIGPYSSAYYIANESCMLTDPEDIARIVEMHTELVRTRPQDGDDTVYLQYETKTGVLIERQYPVVVDGSVGKLLKEYYSSPECIFGTADIDWLLQHIQEINIYFHDEEIHQVSMINNGADGTEMRITGEDLNVTHASIETFASATEVRRLFDTLLADCKAGRLTQHWRYHDEADTVGTVANLSFSYQVGQSRYRHKDIAIFADCTNTLAFLKNLIGEYTKQEA